LTPGLAARRAAAQLLGGVLSGRRSLTDQVADPTGPLGRLEPRDRARAQSLATGTLRHLGRVDALLGRFLDRRPPAAGLNALRLCVAEMQLYGVPAHAAVDGAVRLVRFHPKARHLAGFVNAVARRAAEALPGAWEAAPEAGLPEWIAAPVRAAWGTDALAGIEAAMRREPPLDLTPRDPGTAESLARRLGATLLPTGSIRLERPGQVSALPGYAEGEWWVQDAAAALPVRLLGDLRGAEALDLCAAPGGKTLQLAAAGADVAAVDVSAVRLARLRENLARTRLGAGLVAADALDWQPGRRFDAIVLDAPCSATGTIRRHPDLPHLRGPESLEPLSVLQSALLGRAWDWLRPGGRLVFCTCSLLPGEGEGQAARFASERPAARRLRPDAASLGAEPDWIDAEGGLRLRPDQWPERGGMDGFYAAMWEKAAATA
jgi:16S rRNA (cytosine967-C5)-methyltransferase